MKEKTKDSAKNAPRKSADARENKGRMAGIRILTECAIMIALATVLSLFKLAELPYGGSVTLAAMLPILIIAYRHGVPWGLACGAVYGAIQQLLGLKNLTYFTSALSIVAVIFLDYLIAFAVIGLGGAFRKLKNGSTALLLGALIAGAARYPCHVISGATVWAGLSIPTKAALLYSLVYNATYMIPETIVLCLAAFYLGQALDLKKPTPERIVSRNSPAGAVLRLAAGGVIIGALIYLVVHFFRVMQNAGTGEFDLPAVTSQKIWFYIPPIVVAVLAAAVAVLLFCLAAREDRKAKASGTDRDRT